MTICDNQGSNRLGAGPAEIVKLVKLPLLIADESPLLAAGPPPHVLLSVQTPGEKCIHRTQFYHFTSSVHPK